MSGRANALRRDSGRHAALPPSYIPGYATLSAASTLREFARDTRQRLLRSAQPMLRHQPLERREILAHRGGKLRPLFRLGQRRARALERRILQMH